MSPEERQNVLDQEHLRLLALFHYVSGGVTVCMACIFGFMMAMMAFAFSFMPIQAPATKNCGPAPATGACAGAPVSEPPLEFMLVFFGSFVLVFLVLGILEILSGWWIARRKHRVFTMVVSVPSLLFIPWGTVLSILTLLVLERKSVKALYHPTATRSGV